MGFHAVGDLIAHSRFQDFNPTVLQFGMKLAFEAKQYMTLLAPMVSFVARRVLDHADSNVAELPGPPKGHARLTLVLGRFDAGPVGDFEAYISQVHTTLVNALLPRRSYNDGGSRGSVEDVTLDLPAGASDGGQYAELYGIQAAAYR